MGILRRGTILFVAVFVLLLSCSVDRSQLDKRVFKCSTDEQCGAGYVCYHGLEPLLDPEQAFCVPACGDGCDGYCTHDGACLSTCDPGVEDPSCASGFYCLRTQLSYGVEVEPAGICVPLATCRSDDDCSGLESSCFLSNVGDSLDLGPSVCSQRGCMAGGSCRTGWSCAALLLADVVPPEQLGQYDRCLPNCERHCPPGMLCAESVGVCVPGITYAHTYEERYLCGDDLNCLVGTCQTGLFSDVQQCMPTCDTDQDCWEGVDAVTAHFFYCAQHLGEVAFCDYHWMAPCNDPRVSCENVGLECHSLELRTWSGPQPFQGCSRLCASDDDCADLGGFCGTEEDYFSPGYCFSGAFLSPCDQSERHCFGDLECREITSTLGAHHTCTIYCDDHADCGPVGFCAMIPGQLEDNSCVYRYGGGERCGTLDEACLSNSCVDGVCTDPAQ